MAPEPPIEIETVPIPRPAHPAGTGGRWKVALALALLADALQIGLLPLFAAGALSPLDDALDVAVCLAMIWLLGWHAAFLPSVVTKLIPVVDLFPSWTAAVLYVGIRGRKKRDAPPVSGGAGSPPVQRLSR